MKAIQVDLHTSAAAVTSSVATFQVGELGQLSRLDVLQVLYSAARQTDSQIARQTDQQGPGDLFNSSCG